MLNRIGGSILLSALMMVLAGCASPLKPLSAIDSDSPEQRIATNLVNVLTQLPALHPASADVRMASPRDAFGASLNRALRLAGYGLLPADSDSSGHADDGVRTVVYSVARQVGHVDQHLVEYQLAVGDIRMKRRYQVNGSQVEPASDLYVRGLDATRIDLNDRMFAASVRPAAAPLQLPAETTVANAPASPPVTASPPPVGPARVAVDSVSDMTLDMSTGQGLDPVVYRAGEPITVLVTASRDADLYCFYRDGHGEVVRLFPNRFAPESRVAAGATLELPGSDAWEIRATGSGLTDEIMCLASPSSRDQLPASLGGALDFKALPVEGLQQIVDEYKDLNGEAPLRRIIAVEVI